MKSVPAWVVYSVYRILMFAVPLAVLLLLRIDPLIATVIAAVIGLCLSYVLLRSPREAVARDIFVATRRGKAPAGSDADTEDAAIDEAAARRARPAEFPGSRSEGEGGRQEDAVRKPGEAGEFEGEHKLG